MIGNKSFVVRRSQSGLRKIIVENRDKMDGLVAVLLEKETVEQEEFRR